MARCCLAPAIAAGWQGSCLVVGQRSLSRQPQVWLSPPQAGAEPSNPTKEWLEGYCVTLPLEALL